MKNRLLFLLFLMFIPALSAQQALPTLQPVNQFDLPEIPKMNTAYRVNVGGELFVDAKDQEWLADRLYHEGSGYGYVGVSHVYEYDGRIENTANPPLYQQSRYGLTGYYFDIPNGYYEVILHFSENYYGRAGQRQMKIRIEHKAVMTKFDILAHTRRNNALRLKYDLQKLKLPVLDGRLEVEFFALTDETKLSAIEIRPLNLDAALFKIETRRLHFTTESDSLGLLIRNLGDRPAYWQADVAALPIWFNLSEAEGWLQPKEIHRIICKINRKLMDPGLHDSVLKLTGNAFFEEIPFSAAVEGKSHLSSVTTELDFAEASLMLPLHIKNTGGRPTAWAVENKKLPEWISRIYPDEGTLDMGESCQLNVVVDRKFLSPGTQNDLLSFRATHNTLSIPIQISGPSNYIRPFFVNSAATGLNNGQDWENAFYSIQMALTAAKRLGTSVPVEIWVAAGHYPEHHLMVTENVSLYGGFHGYENQRNERRLEPRFRSIVDGQKRGRVFELRHRTVLDGFVIENGREWADKNDAGAAILTYDADVIVRNCLVRQNTVSEKGVIFIDGSDRKKSRNGHSPLIERNVIVNNFSRSGTAGIFCRDSRAIVRNNTIVGNRGDGIRIPAGKSKTVPPIMAHFENNIITLNDGHSGQDVAGFAQKAVSYSYVGQRWTVPKSEQPFGYGIGNIFSGTAANPGFVAPESGDFHLAPDSPCIDAGNPASSLDSDSTLSDLGAFSYDASDGKLDVSISKIVFDSKSKGRKFQIRGYGTKPIKWQIATRSDDGAEFEVTPSSGIIRNGDVVSIAVLPQRKRLSDGQYHGWLAVLTEEQSLEIELIVNNATELPELHASPEQVNVNVDLYGARPDPIPVKIENGGGGEFTWTVFGADQPKWLKILSKNGGDGENLWLQLETNNLEFGNYYHELTIRAAGTINQEIRIPVSLSIVAGEFTVRLEAEKPVNSLNNGWKKRRNRGYPGIEAVSQSLKEPNSRHKLNYDFYIPKGVDEVYVFAEYDAKASRIKDSFWISINGDKPIRWDNLNRQHNGWQRAWVHKGRTGNKEAFQVHSGKNTLHIYPREAGISLNWLVITNQSMTELAEFRF